MHFATCKFQLVGCGAWLAGARVDSLLRPTHGAGGAGGSGETVRHHGLPAGGGTSAIRTAGRRPHPHPRGRTKGARRWLCPPSTDGSLDPPTRTDNAPRANGGCSRAATAPRRLPTPPGAPEPPGGERPGRLPGPHGPDRPRLRGHTPARAACLPGVLVTAGTARRAGGLPPLRRRPPPRGLPYIDAGKDAPDPAHHTAPGPSPTRPKDSHAPHSHPHSHHPGRRPVLDPHPPQARLPGTGRLTGRRPAARPDPRPSVPFRHRGRPPAVPCPSRPSLRPHPAALRHPAATR